MHKLGELSHQFLVALHSASSVDQDHIVVFGASLLQCFFGDDSRVILVALLVEWDVETRSMRSQLLNCARPEVIATSEHNFEITLRLKIVGHLGK